jgi:hypothetical protein
LKNQDKQISEMDCKKLEKKILISKISKKVSIKRQMKQDEMMKNS